MASSGMIYIPSLIKIGSGIEKVVKGRYTKGDLESPLLFFLIG
jgi:hypothetical protein